MDFTRRTYSKEGKNCPIGLKCGGHRFLAFRMCDLDRLPRERQNVYRAEYYHANQSII